MSKKRTRRGGGGRQGGAWIARHVRLAIYMRDHFACAYCGRDLRGLRPEEVTLDHLVCHCHGGSDHPSNLVTACRSCNSARGNRPWTEYATGGAVQRIRNLRRRVLNTEFARELTRGNGAPAIVLARELDC